MTEAATYAQDQLERLRVTAWSDQIMNDGNHSNNIPAGLSGIAYGRTWSVATTGTIKTVTITLSWTDAVAPHSFNLVSAILNPNL